MSKNVFQEPGDNESETSKKSSLRKYALPEANAEEQDRAHLDKLSKEQKTTTPHRSRPVHPAIAWVLAALLAGGVIAFRNSHSTILSKDQAMALIEPSLQPHEATAQENQHYRDTREIMASLREGADPDTSALGAAASTARMVMQYDTGDTATLNSLTGFISGNFEPLGKEKPFFGQAANVTRAQLASRISASLRNGNHADAIGAASADLSIYPLLMRAKGMDVSDIMQVFAEDPGANASEIPSMTESMTAEERQKILDSGVALDLHSALAHDALSHTFGEQLLPTVLDPEQRYKLLAMLAIPHTLPIDERATMEMANKVFVAVDKNLSGDYAHRDLTPEKTATTLGAELGPLLEGDPYYNLGTLDVIKTRWKLWWHDNLTGKYLVYNEIPQLLKFQEAMFLSRTNYQASRLQLALSIYASNHNGQMPAKLDDLVRDKIVPSVPIDPMSGSPFVYDASRKTFWSIGLDGKDDGGLPKKDLVYPESVVIVR